MLSVSLSGPVIINLIGLGGTFINNKMTGTFPVTSDTRSAHSATPSLQLAPWDRQLAPCSRQPAPWAVSPHRRAVSSLRGAVSPQRDVVSRPPRHRGPLGSSQQMTGSDSGVNFVSLVVPRGHVVS